MYLDRKVRVHVNKVREKGRDSIQPRINDPSMLISSSPINLLLTHSSSTSKLHLLRISDC